jgi:ADP-ribosylglycohydrolase
VYCAFAYPDCASAIRAAVNHDGDSDSTGSICGNLVGAAKESGDELGELFGVGLVEIVASDLALEMTQPPQDLGIGSESAPSWWWYRYPGW